MRYSLSFLFSIFLATAFGQLITCSECAERIIETSEIETLSLDEINLLKNEIYARNGYRFESSRLDEYFSSQPWYTEANSNDDVVLNKTEKANVSMLSKREKTLEKERTSLLEQLDELKDIVLKNDTTSLRKKFDWEPDFSSESVKWMAPTFELVQPKSIHFYKHQGKYEVAIDDGYKIVYHSITVDGSRVMINQNTATHSEIIPDFDEYTDYRSEMEETYMGWEFEFKDGNLRFVRELFAG